MLTLLVSLLLASPSFADAPSTPTAEAQAPVAIRTGGQPSADQLAALAKEGVRTVIDLRGPTESRGMDEAAVVTGLGMTYLSLPVAGAGDVTVAKARELSALLDQAEGPVLVHCASSNRVGALLALEAAYVDGHDAASALERGRAAGLSSLLPVVQQLLAER